MKTLFRLFAVMLTLEGYGTIAAAQQPKKIRLIGYLSSSDPASDSTRFEAIRLALRERGHIEGQNIASEFRYTEGKPDLLPRLAAELVRLKVDIIVIAGGVLVVQAAKDATKTIPIVMIGGGSDPVQAGLVESLARPGGNVTGLTNLGGERGVSGWSCSRKPLANLPVAVLYQSAIPSSVLELKEVFRSRRGRWG